MIQKANERFTPKPSYEIIKPDQIKGGDYKATMIVNNPDGSVIRVTHVGPHSRVAKGMCAEEVLSSVACRINYTSICNILCMVS
jgi:hypothetical protein